MSEKNPPCACIILAAGKGTRMKSNLPKTLHRVAGRPLISHVLDAASSLKPERMVAVLAPDIQKQVKEEALEEYPDCAVALQREQKGTGHAVLAAREALKGFRGVALVLYGDTPLITPATLSRLLKEARDAEAVVLGMRPHDPTGYGRLIHSPTGELERIVEHRDASWVERNVRLCNSGVMAVHTPQLFALLAKVKPQSKNGEYYLTDVVALAKAAGLTVRVAEGEPEELSGINTRAQLADAENAMQQRLRERAMEHGATFIAPETVFLSADTVIGKDTIVHPFVIFGPGVKVGEEVEIRSFCHFEEAKIGDRCVVGPYARMRPGSSLAEEAHLGNFVEIKKTKVGRGAKINHLSYVGDSTVGAGANVGAGTITCNFDGFTKHHTEIGEGAFIGSNTSLVAPVEIGAGAVVGAGSVVTEDVPPGALAVERSEQKIKPGGAERMKAKKGKK